MESIENINEIDAKERTLLGTGSSRSTRRSARVPCVLYGKNKPTLHIDVDSRSLIAIYKKGLFNSKVMELNIDGKKTKVVPKKVDLHPVTESIMHVDFVYLGNERHILDVPVRFIDADKSIGVKRGGFFNINIRKIKVEVDAKNIPSFFEYNCSGLVVGSKIKTENIVLPENCNLMSKKGLVLASLIGKASKDDAESATTPAAAAKKK